MRLVLDNKNIPSLPTSEEVTLNQGTGNKGTLWCITRTRQWSVLDFTSMRNVARVTTYSDIIAQRHKSIPKRVTYMLSGGLPL